MEARPLSTFDDERPDYEIDPALVWRSRLDGRYLIEVVRDEADPDYRAHLRVFDAQHELACRLDEAVGLAYGARFGPDVDDVATWQERVLKLVDATA